MIVATSSRLDARRRAARRRRGSSRASAGPRSTTSWKRREAGLARRVPVDQDHVVERRALRPDRQDLAELLERRDEDRPRAAVLQQGRDLGGRAASGRSAPTRLPRTGWRSRPWPTRAGSPRGSRRGRPAGCRGRSSPSERARTVKPKSAAEIGFQTPADLRDQEVGLSRTRPPRRRCRRGSGVRSPWCSLLARRLCRALRGRSRFVRIGTLRPRASASPQPARLWRDGDRAARRHAARARRLPADVRPGLRRRRAPRGRARPRVSSSRKHVAYAIPTVLLSLFSQSMVIFFFIGTGRLVKDEIAGYRRGGPPRASSRALRRLQAADLAAGDLRAAFGDRASSCSAAPCTRAPSAPGSTWPPRSPRSPCTSGRSRAEWTRLPRERAGSWPTPRRTCAGGPRPAPSRGAALLAVSPAPLEGGRARHGRGRARRARDRAGARRGRSRRCRPLPATRRRRRRTSQPRSAPRAAAPTRSARRSAPARGRAAELVRAAVIALRRPRPAGALGRQLPPRLPRGHRRGALGRRDERQRPRRRCCWRGRPRPSCANGGGRDRARSRTPSPRRPRGTTSPTPSRRPPSRASCARSRSSSHRRSPSTAWRPERCWCPRERRARSPSAGRRHAAEEKRRPSTTSRRRSSSSAPVRRSSRDRSCASTEERASDDRVLSCGFCFERELGCELGRPTILPAGDSHYPRG